MITEPSEQCAHREYGGKAEVLEKNTEYKNTYWMAEVREGQKGDGGMTRQRGKA